MKFDGIDVCSSKSKDLLLSDPFQKRSHFQMKDSCDNTHVYMGQCWEQVRKRVKRLVVWRGRKGQEQEEDLGVQLEEEEDSSGVVQQAPWDQA